MSYAQVLMEPVRWMVDAIGNLITTQINIERLNKLVRDKVLELRAELENRKAADKRRRG